MYAFASPFPTCADSAALGDSNFTSTSRLFRIGETVRSLRNRSMTRDCCFVSSPPGTCAGAAVLNHDETKAAGAATIFPTVRFSSLGFRSGCSHSLSPSIVRRASARLWRILYCVW